MKLIKI